MQANLVVAFGRRVPLVLISCRRLAWQSHQERRRAIAGVCDQFATTRAHDLVCDVETETEISGCRCLVLLCAVEGLEDEREGLGRNGLPVVDDLDDDFRTLGVRLDDNARSRRGMLGGVPGDVGESFRQAIGVPKTGHVALDLQLERGPEFFGDVPAYLAQIGEPSFDGKPSPEASAGELEKLKDHPRHAFTAGEDARRRPLIFDAEAALEKQRFGRQADRPQSDFAGRGPGSR